MKDLIDALTILSKYQQLDHPLWPTSCEHDTFYVHGIKGDVSTEDRERLEALGFIPSEDVEDSWLSFQFGSA